MCKFEIQVVYPCERHSLSTVVRRQAGGPGRNEIRTARGSLNESGVHVAVLTGLLRMAHGAAGILHACKELVLSREIRPIMLFGAKRCEIRVACLACIRRFVPVMATHALRHFRDALFRGERHLVKALVTILARELLIIEVKCVIEFQITLRVFECNIRGNVVRGVAVGAVVRELFFMAGLAVRFLCQEIIRGGFACRSFPVAVLAPNACLLDMKLMRELDQFSAVLIRERLA